VSVRRDHIAGGAFVLIGALVLALSGDLPFGTLASPGAGMMPTLLTLLMMAFGIALMVRARASPPFAEISWTDLPHALRVAALAAAAAALYLLLGFALTMTLLLVALILGVERRPLLPAVAFSLVAVAVVYILFAILLRTPLPGGPLGF
jgi:ammonia channel protein AmtB